VVAGCVFCAIVRGELPAEVVLRTDEVCAFLDARPLFLGHVLVVPRAHVETLGDLDQAQVAPLFIAVQKIARAVGRGLGAAGSFVALNNRVSQSVPHLHVHVVPRNQKDGLRGFFWPRKRYESDEQRRDYAERIIAALE
jgi:histidine triad (HIT) family protein